MKDQKWFEDMEQRIPHGEVRTRFAPSPTGYMHVGNLRTALYTYLIARHAGGKFILRIEDTDQGRYVEGAVDVIYSTMRACGLTHDEGPDVGGPVGPYVQTERRGLYKEYAELLIARGHAYRCFCDKDDAAEENVSDGAVIHKYDGRCSRLSEEEIAANLAAGKPYVIRQKIPREGKTTFHDEIFGDITVDNDTLDDQVLIKRDGLPTYNFANVIDDHLMGITHVVRGSEYLSSTPKYNLLYEGFGWEIPKYIHCSPVMRDQHNKMSKRHGDPSYEDLKAQGFLTDAILNYVALLGWAPKGEYAEQEIFSLDDHLYIPGSFDTPSYGLALYHQSTYNNLFTEGLSITAGIRLDYEKQKMDYNSEAKMRMGFGFVENGPVIDIEKLFPIPTTVMDASVSQDFWQVLPKISLKYECSPNTFTYVSVAKGYKTGGYNVQMSADVMQSQMQYDMMSAFKDMMPIEVKEPTPIEEVAAYKPEKSWNYEIGIRSELLFQRLSAELTGFYMDIKDVQLTKFVNSGNGRILTNAGKAKSYGIEASLRARIIDGLTADVNYGFTHATFRDYNNGKEDFKNNLIPYTPRQTFNVGLQQRERVLISQLAVI